MVADMEVLETAEPSPKKLKEEPLNNAQEDIDQSLKIKNAGETKPNPLSKNQIKKLRKLQNFEIVKKEKRLRERERLKQKRQEAIANGLPTRKGPSRKELKKKQVVQQEGALRAIIDLDYDDLMHDRDVAKCVKQCLRIYTINRRAKKPSQLHFTGIKPDGRIHTALKKNDGYENWHVKYHFGQCYADVFSKDEIVYLSSDSDTVLESLQPNKVYIIGGLVDHNHQKGLCHERATKLGFKTARLPLNEHVDMKTRTVLSTFHVFELLMRVSEGVSWTDAILETIPMRKGAKPKQEQQPSASEQTQDAAERSAKNSTSSINTIKADTVLAEEHRNVEELLVDKSNAKSES